MVPTRSSLHRPLPTNETSSSIFFVTLFLSLVGLSLSSSSSVVPVELTSFQCGLLHQHKRRDCRVVREKWKTFASVSHTTATTATSTTYSEIIRKASRSHYHASKNDYSSTTKLYNSGSSSISNDENNNNGEEEIQRILRRYGFGNRLVTLNHADLSERPMPAEIYEGGVWKMCLIVGLKPPSSSSSNNGNNLKPPLLDIVSMDDGGILQEKKVVDIGQITTLWDDMHEISPNINNNALADSLQSNIRRAQQNLQNNIFPVEQAMQNLYNGRIANRSQQQQRSHNNKNRQRQQSYALTKKQIPKIASQLSNNSSNNINRPTAATQQHLEELLRNLLKVGEDRLSRLVDSTMATDYLYSDYARDGDDNELVIRRMVGATVLAEDAVSGGRFKRRSCQFVSANYSEEIDDVEEENNHAVVVVQEVTLVNGGWIAVDPSIKAGTEGRKFAATTTATTTTSSSSSSNAKGKNDGGVGRRSEQPPILTAADERIAHRLECLAMGDAWKSGDDSSNRRRRREDEEDDSDEKMLELDVRMALKSMNLPLTPQGATSALVKLGRWSSSSASSSSGTTTDGKKNKKKTNEGSSVVEPWSPELLDAARSLALYEGKRRESLANTCFESSLSKQKKKKGSSNKTQQRALLADGFEGRVDLSSLPCVCIDAKRATFRDDSIGVRLRSSTGRKVNKSASKWEVLVHIADVSDIYFDGGKFDADIIVPSKKDVNNMHLLREASERRGQSRYDLPLGPLHLLPPVALTALSLATNKEKTPNRCVTLWVYIDERDGKLLEAGLERTIISSPTALSFTDATTLLGSNADKVSKLMSNSKAVLSVAERNLSLWSQRHMQRDRAAQKKEKRRSTRELISKELSAAAGNQARDDGVGGSFQRSRGHRIVDSSLDVYAFAVGTLMRRANQPIPRAAGSGADRGGRLGTAPLRRYIDGLAQRQALSVLCGYGTPLTKEECIEASKIAARASDNIANLRSSKQSPMVQNEYGNQRSQVSALYKLARHLASTGGIQNRQRVKAVSTGHNNEVVILGAGATARCKGVKGTLKSGEKLLVRVDKIDPEVGVLNVSLV